MKSFLSLAEVCEAMQKDKFYINPSIIAMLCGQLCDRKSLGDDLIQTLLANFNCLLLPRESRYYKFFNVILLVEKFGAAMVLAGRDFREENICFDRLRAMFREIKFPLPSELFPGAPDNTDKFLLYTLDSEISHSLGKTPYPLHEIQDAVDGLCRSLMPVNVTPQPAEMTSQKVKRKQKRGAIKQRDAASLCGVGERLFQQWEAGQKTPEGFPGRSDAMVFRAWANTYLSRERLKEAAISMNRAIPVDPADLEDMEDKNNTWG